MGVLVLIGMVLSGVVVTLETEVFPKLGTRPILVEAVKEKETRVAHLTFVSLSFFFSQAIAHPI